MDMAGQNSNNSSDFVRKLYKMLEDPSYSSVVRWGDDGDSFVVLENEKFTKHILPKHFKHSNFASFVRQLNKYDFHKVRQNNEDGQQSQYGPNAWEFKHPEFKANSKDTLDNIRRKAPAPRKQGQAQDGDLPIQQIDLMNQQMVAQAQQIQLLEASNHELRANHQTMVQELVRLHRTVLNHDKVMQDVMKYLNSVDAQQRRNSKALFPNTQENAAGTNLTPTSQNIGAADDEIPASPLQHAQQLMQEYNVDSQLNFTGFDPNYPQQGNGMRRGPGSAHSSVSVGYSKLNDGQLEQMVYPTGGNNGIDPMYSEHLPNIPYPMPGKEIDATELRTKYAETRKKSNYNDPGWIRNPRILLVEDDPTCRQIGAKFLHSFSCTIDTALDGLEAVNKIQEGAKYDMILMDIIMPNLDGVSACHIVRQFDRTPIVAMTSNIRQDDIQMYFQHGMDDVLPKPFTRKSLLDMLEKHLIGLKKLPAGMEPPPPHGVNPSMTTHSSGPSIRDDMSAAASPAGSTGTWNSPSQYSGVSPVAPGMPMQYPTYMDNNTAAYHQQQTSPMNPNRGMPPAPMPPQGITQQLMRGPSDMLPQDMKPAKRQRVSGTYGGPPMTARQQ
ncbi:kinase-regulated stress-responsive transcription factor skn7 [Exophiala xenobiotica]|uniref:Transcription factor n=1 Tax=Lithohypha guttulata TaxID=1690604 RepID=A0ABR0K6G2_9EURO|nr:kinase-regulated stress-responsive transcription factor skn7 [Lithohypha guttulata]KAK5313968.1 kinase-regulated stress-responsive transcription factor skn7 [Exophiala xenobiotica]